MTRLRTFAKIALSFALVCAAAPAAFAQSPDAVESKRKGDEAMDALRYDDALAAYTKAYELGHDPAVLYNRGRVHQARGEWPLALEDLERFEREAAPEMRAKVPRLAELLAEVRGHVATLNVRCNVAGARVLVRGAVVGTTPLSATRVNAGAASIEIEAEGYLAYRTEIALQGNGTNALDVTLEAKAKTGTLVVKSAGPAATVFVDGEKVGMAPVEIERGAGNHRVVLRRESGDDVEASTVIAPGERRELAFDAPSTPLTKRWWFWTGIGAVAAGAVVTVFLVTHEKSPSNGDSFQPGRVSGPLVAW